MNQTGRMSEDVPLLGETTYSRWYLICVMILCQIVHLICLEWVHSGIVDMMIYLFLCLIFAPLLYLLFVAQSERALTYYLTGELGMKTDQFLTILVISVVSFGLSFLISLASVKELINIYANDVLMVPVPLQLTNSSYMALFYIVFVLIMPVAEESLWRIFLPKSFSTEVESTLFIATMYGIMNFIIVHSLFSKWEYALIALIYSFLIHLVFSYVHQHTKALGLFSVSFAMRAGIALSLHIFLFLKIEQASAHPAIPSSPLIAHNHN